MVFTRANPRAMTSTQRHDHGIVPGVDGRKQQPARTGQGKDFLNDHPPPRSMPICRPTKVRMGMRAFSARVCRSPCAR